MARKWGKVDYRQFEKLQKQMQDMERTLNQPFMESCAKELAGRLLAKVIDRTPTRKPENCPPGVTGGTLRRGWTGQNKASAKAYAESIRVNKIGHIYEVELINPVEYASYVEFGHRTRNHEGWVSGRFMMTISEQEIESMAPKILEKKLMKYLGEMFNDQ